MLASIPAPPRDDPSPPPAARGSLVARLASALASALGTATLAALVASVPAALRLAPVAGPPAGPLGPWLVLSAASLPPLWLAVLLLRGARRGLADLAGERALELALGAALWLAVSADALTLLGAALRATTHHHGLAGATFGVFGLAVLVGLAALVARLVALAASWPRAVGALVLGAGLAVALAGLGVLALRAGRAGGAGAVNLLVDTACYAVAAALASSAALARRPVAFVGPPVALMLLAAGLSRPLAAVLASAVEGNAPLLAPVVRLLGQLGR
jgi:hypothetical protein